MTLVKVDAGEAIVWYDGQLKEIVGISFGPNTSLEVTGDVFGDIVGNLLPNGRLSDTDNNPLNGEDGGVLLPNNLIGLKTSNFQGQTGSIGNIITGGSLSNLNIVGKIHGMYAGDGVFNDASALLMNDGTVESSLGNLDFNPIEPGAQTTFTFAFHPVLAPSASISNITISQAVEFQAIAGSGNPNHLDLSKVAAQPGGSITNISIDTAIEVLDPLAQNLPPSYTLIAGDGGSGAKGGAGGTINDVVEHTSAGQVIIKAGHGGDGGAGAGGGGGSVMNLDLQSNSSQYTVVAGNGGKGTPGGAGGSTTSNSFANNTPAGGIIISADFTGDGVDDVLIADQGTGQMVLEQHNATGITYTPIVQHDTETLISPPLNTTTPVAAAAVHFNSAGDLPDIMVAYKGSHNLVIYENQGTGVQTDPTANPPTTADPNNGVFWNPALVPDPGYQTVSVGLSFAPSKMAVLDSRGTEVALAENINGQGFIHLVDTNFGTSDLQEVDGSFALPAPVAGMVKAADGTVIVGLTNGDIYSLAVHGEVGLPFELISHERAAVSGGISDIDIDSEGTHLLALSSNGKTLSVFNEGAAAGNTQAVVLAATINLSSLGAGVRPEVAHFISRSNGFDSIALLSARTAGAQMNIYDLNGSSNTDSITSATPETPPLTTTQSLTNFAVTSTGTEGFAALQTSLGQFTFDKDFGSILQDFGLPFASKVVNITAGNGGDGVDIGNKLGKGGAGGGINAINADAHSIVFKAGDGGASQRGAAGSGGSFTNPDSIKTAGGLTVAALILADESVTITGGTGGTPTASGDAHTTGGSGGSVNGFSITLNAGSNDLLLTLAGGDGGDGHGGNGGAGGSVNGVTATGRDGGISVHGGDGGDSLKGSNGTSGAGGVGGSINNLTYTLTLDAEAAAIERPHSAFLETGNGGSSEAGLGGAAGGIANANLQMQASDRTSGTGDTHLDSTITVGVGTGHGGDGTKGGNGGFISNFQYATVITQVIDNHPIIPFVSMSIEAGDGGKGLTLNGGNGGGISLSKPIAGITYIDPDSDDAGDVPLFVLAGTGGNGATKGGVGGSVNGLVVQNAPFVDGSKITQTQLVGAVILAGDGGDGTASDGGAGGAITNSLLGAELATYIDPQSSQLVRFGGFIDVIAGHGGVGGLAGAGSAPKAKGGAGGLVSNDELGLVSTAESVGMMVNGGAGGAGNSAGGLGGGIMAVRVNISQSDAFNDVPSVLLTAGKGGDANSSSGVGGKGGDVSNLTEAKDENSAINLIQAGDGGDTPGGKGGLGGNILNIKTVGFIGRPSNGNTPLGAFDAIDGDEFAQGLFSGRGGTGASNGANGSIINVIARQIAAMSAAENTATGLFAPATKITNVTADLIGYDADRETGNAGDGVFNDSHGGSASPAQVKPQDGFILGTTISKVTGERDGFVFTA